MRSFDSLTAPSPRRFDLTLLFVVVVLVFVTIAVAQFSRGWADAQRGLLLYERTCPLNGGVT